MPSVWERVVNRCGHYPLNGGHFPCHIALDFDRNTKHCDTETNHLEWETENQKPQQKRTICKEFVRTTDTDYCVSRNWKNHLGCWKGGVSLRMWPMEEIESKSYQRFVSLNRLLNVAEYWKKTKHKTYFTFVSSVQSVQLLSCVWLFETPWIAALQASLSITNSRSSCKIMSIESVMPSSHLILCHPLLLLPPILPESESFPMSQLFTCGQSTGVSALASFLPMNTQDWFPLEWAGWISLQSKGLSRVFSNTTVQKHQFFSAQLAS